MRPLDGYPTSWGSSRASVFPVAGAESYVQYVAPSTGGQDVTVMGPSGVKTVDFAQGGITTDGLYEAKVVRVESANVNGVTVAKAKIVLKWYVVATGAEVAALFDLSGSTVNLLVIGPK